MLNHPIRQNSDRKKAVAEAVAEAADAAAGSGEQQIWGYHRGSDRHNDGNVT